VVTLTRLTGSVFALNSDLIERVDSTPDTVITLVDGTKYLVRESIDEVVAAVRAYRGGIVADSARLSASHTAAPRPVVEALPVPEARPAGEPRRLSAVRSSTELPASEKEL
jgi:flagellar protein FlbD